MSRKHRVSAKLVPEGKSFYEYSGGRKRRTTNRSVKPWMLGNNVKVGDRTLDSFFYSVTTLNTSVMGFGVNARVKKIYCCECHQVVVESIRSMSLHVTSECKYRGRQYR